MRASGLVAALAAALFSTAAPAQDAAPALPEDPRAARFREIERGFFTGLEAGWMGFFETPVAEPTRYRAAGKGGGMSSGLHLALTVGADLGERVSLALLLLGVNQEAGVSYGAFSLVGGGGDLRVNLAGFADSQQVTRTFVYAHARGAWFVTEPHGLFGKTDVLVAGGVGVEYFTRLRHFSVGLAVDGLYALQAKSAGIAATPTLRYTF
jgi:hypothetical protein